jgi:hypothetical protein
LARRPSLPRKQVVLLTVAWGSRPQPSAKDNMRLDEIDLIGKPTPSFAEIQKKHGVSASTLKAQLLKGIKVEQEHTGDIAMAREIALDHLDEFPDYYDRLDRAEKR